MATARLGSIVEDGGEHTKRKPRSPVAWATLLYHSPAQPFPLRPRGRRGQGRGGQAVARRLRAILPASRLCAQRDIHGATEVPPPHLTSPHLTSPHLTSPHLASPPLRGGEGTLGAAN